MRPIIRTALPLALASLALPASAQAGFVARGTTWEATTDSERLVVRVDGDVLGHDQIGQGFASRLDFDNATPGVQTLQITSGFSVTFKGGANTFSATTLSGPVTVTAGGTANRILTGSGPDVITTGDGEDSVDPGAGTDTVDTRGDDDEVSVPVNADADVLALGGGDDTVAAIGTAGEDVRALSVDPSTDRLRLKQSGTSTTTFTGLSIEHVDFRGNGGSDALNASDPALRDRTDLTFSGGPGFDSVLGTPNADHLDGGEQPDIVGGGDGDDTIDLSEGADSMSGDAGDDLLVVHGSPVTDEFDVTRSGASLSVFGGAATTFERLRVQAGGGGDLIRIGTGVTQLVRTVLLGEGGDDILIGTDGDEEIRGGQGADSITPGTGANVVDGGPDDDTIRVRDGADDTIACGQGTDAVSADGTPLDATTDCESVDRPAPPAATPPPAAAPAPTGDPAPTPTPAPPAAVSPAAPPVAGVGVPAPRPALALVASTRRLRGGILRVTARCPAASPAACRGTVRVLRGRRVIATRRVTLAPGGRTVFRVRAGGRARVQIA